jgi:hypothetical protein
MSIESEFKELKLIAKAVAAVGFMLWSALPMFILGWLASAVGRHPIAEEQISSELAYKFLLLWQGGINSFPPVFMLMLFLSGLIVLSYALRKYGYSHPIDGMEKGRIILRKFLIPAYLSFSAFAGGIVSGGSLAEMKPGIFLLLLLTVFAGFIHYITDTSDLA